ncbi:hypothetical protein M058_01330 [Streptococcus mitis 17/34]|nr:hypothetical protein M058_01330 [Streptococcus mitis 17/34]
MKFKKLITLASLVGLITFLLPVVSSGNQSLAPVSEHVSEYLHVPLWYLFLIWYGAFVIAFLLSLVIGKGRVLQIITSIIVILVSLFGIFVHFSLTQELVGRSNLGFGAILYYVCILINIFAAIMVIKGDKATSKRID